MPAASPLINGHRFSWASIEVKIGGEVMGDLQGITYNQSNEKSKVMGKGQKARGKTRGVHDCDATITLLLSAANDLRAALGDNYGAVNFDIVVMFSENGEDTSTHVLEGCSIDTESNDYQQGPDGLVEEIGLSVMDVVKNGLRMVVEAQ